MQNISGVCLRGLSSLQQEFSQINIYDVYVDFCLRGQQQSAQRLAEATGYDQGSWDPGLLPWVCLLYIALCPWLCEPAWASYQRNQAATQAILGCCYAGAFMHLTMLWLCCGCGQRRCLHVAYHVQPCALQSCGSCLQGLKKLSLDDSGTCWLPADAWCGSALEQHYMISASCSCRQCAADS